MDRKQLGAATRLLEDSLVMKAELIGAREVYLEEHARLVERARSSHGGKRAQRVVDEILPVIEASYLDSSRRLLTIEANIRYLRNEIQAQPRQVEQ